MAKELSVARSETLEALLSGTLVGVVRDRDQTRAHQIAQGLLDAGFRAVEVTATTPGCFEVIKALDQRVRQPRVVLGVGSIRTLAQLNAAEQAGARFIVSPHTDPELIAAAVQKDMIVIPGAMTPTEVVTALSAGANLVKLFPITTLGGARYLRLLRGPLPDAPLWVSGDVGLEEIPAYLDAGASLIGLTSALTAELPQDLLPAVHARAAKAMELLLRAREGNPLLTLTGPSGKLTLGLKELRKLSGTEHTSLASVIPGRKGHAVRIRLLLQSIGAPPNSQVQLRSYDGFTRAVTAQSLYDGGFIQYASDGHPLDRAGGGPLRLYIVDGPDQCDNVKGLSQIDVL